MSKNKKITIAASAVLASSVFLTGCGLFGGGEQKKIDPPQDVTYLEEGESLETIESTETTETTGTEQTESGEDAVVESMQTELYLMDKNGYIVPQSVSLPKTQSVAKQALEYLIQSGPIEQMLPNGFKAVLPADTRVLGVNIKDGVAIADFSPEFKNYAPEDEMKILQAITWTLTQYDSVDKVKIRINGYDQTEMPVNGTPLSDGVSRANGINMDTTSVIDITNTKPVTLYFLSQAGESYYYVPVTKRISNDEKNNITAVVNELIKGPGMTSQLLTSFMPDAKLIEEPKVENGTVTLNFNEGVYGSFEEKMVSEEILNELVLSLTEQQGIESVAVLVNGEAELMNENGEALTEPVTRPQEVNKFSF